MLVAVLLAYAAAPTNSSADARNTLACACFSWCHPQEVSDFWGTLPVVTSRESPWMPLLRSLYGQDAVPLPLDLGEFGGFRVPSVKPSALASHPAIPFARRCDKRTLRARAPRCALSECARWLNLSEASVRALPRVANETVSVNKHAAGTVHLRWLLPPADGARDAEFASRANARTLYGVSGGGFINGGSFPHVRLQRWFSYLLPGPAVLPREPRWLVRRVLARKHALAALPAVRNGSWLEVIRHSTPLPEGFVYGCWFYVLTPPHARGTGIFVNVGRLRVFSSKVELHTLCAEHGFAFTGGLPAASAPAPAWLFRRAKGEGALHNVLADFPDSHLAFCAQSLGFDAVVLRREGILVRTTAACVVPGAQRKPGACPPETELRTGWSAQRPCACADDAAGRAQHAAERDGNTTRASSRANQMLNCAGTREDPSGPAPDLTTQASSVT